MRILVSGGGSGGHVLPVLATVDALRNTVPDAKVLYVGQKNSLEAAVAKAAHLEFATITAGKLRRYGDVSFIRTLADVRSLALNARDATRLVRGVQQSLKILRGFKPDIVFLKGGFVCLPIGLACAMQRVPYVIHESDLRLGLTNKVLARWAQKVAVGFPARYYKELPPERLVYTGIPVRTELTEINVTKARKHFGLSEDLPVALLTGGGLGSQSLNDVVLNALPQLAEHYQLLHVAGEKDFEHVRFELKQRNLNDLKNYYLFSFLREDMPQALAVADVVVTRAGATTLAELAVLAKPTIVVPHPSLSDQALNAKTLARAGAIRVLPQTSLTPASLRRELDSISGSKKEQALLSKGIKAFAKLDAAEELASLILSQAPVEPEPEEEDVRK